MLQDEQEAELAAEAELAEVEAREAAAAAAEAEAEALATASTSRQTILAKLQNSRATQARSSSAFSESLSSRKTMSGSRKTMSKGLQRLGTRRMNDKKDYSVEEGKAALEEHAENMHDAMNAIPSLEPFAVFYQWCIQRFGNLTRCWRNLDQSLNMRLTYLEFLTSLRKYEFSGDARLIFKVLDRDKVGALPYYRLDPYGAVELAQLKSWLKTTFGGVSQAFSKLDTDQNGKITTEEFRDGARRHGLQSDESLPHIVEMLDLDHDRKIDFNEMRFLDHWDCPPWLMAAPDFTGAQEFKTRLKSKYRGNAIVAWHFGLDLNHMMRISWQEFEEAGKREGILKTQLPGIWRALDTNLSGWLSLHEWDPDVFKLLVDFKKYCAKWGSIKQALPKLDNNSNGAVSKKELLSSFKDMGLQEWEVDTLFTGLEQNGDGMITRQKIEYLDKWKVDEDSQEEEFWHAVGDCLQSKHKSLGHH